MDCSALCEPLKSQRPLLDELLRSAAVGEESDAAVQSWQIEPPAIGIENVLDDSEFRQGLGGIPLRGRRLWHDLLRRQKGSSLRSRRSWIGPSDCFVPLIGAGSTRSMRAGSEEAPADANRCCRSTGRDFPHSQAKSFIIPGPEWRRELACRFRSRRHVSKCLLLRMRGMSVTGPLGPAATSTK